MKEKKRKGVLAVLGRQVRQLRWAGNFLLPLTSISAPCSAGRALSASIILRPQRPQRPSAGGPPCQA